MVEFVVSCAGETIDVQDKKGLVADNGQLDFCLGFPFPHPFGCSLTTYR